jgi:hypothetical protein
LLLAQPDIADLSKQVELALIYDAKLDVAAMKTGTNFTYRVEMRDDARENIIEHLAGASP